MTDSAEYSNHPSWLQSLRNPTLAQIHGTTTRIAEDEVDNFSELTDLENATVTPTAGSYLYGTTLSLYSSGVMRQQTNPPDSAPLSITENTNFDHWTVTILHGSEIIEIYEPPETRWIQNIRNPSYQLRRPIPIVIERDCGLIMANYDDLELNATGGSLQAAISGLCEKIVACYEENRKPSNRSKSPPTQEQEFLDQIIVETQPKAWNELKRLYAEELKAFAYVDKGYIHISSPDYADVILILSEESADRIARLAGVDLEINQKFLPLNFTVEYRSSEEYVDLSDFVRFL